MSAATNYEPSRLEYFDLIEKFFTDYNRMHIYHVVRAGWWRGIETEDAGRVYNCEVYAVISFAGYFRNEYSYYQSLPDDPDILWVTEAEYHERIRDFNQRVRTAKAGLVA